MNISDQKRPALTGRPNRRLSLPAPAGLFAALFSFAAAAYTPVLPIYPETEKQKLLPSGVPDLSGEWVFPCQNLGTDGMVFSRLVWAAYIGSQAVFSYADFEGPNCKCENFLEEYKELWHFELLDETEIFSGIYKIDYYGELSGDLGALLSDRLWMALIKREGQKLYFSFPGREPLIRPEELDREPYLFARHLTETAEDYMAKGACPLEKPFAEAHAL